MATNPSVLMSTEKNIILLRIEAICLDVMQSISHGRAPKFSFSRRRKWDELQFDETVGVKCPVGDKSLLEVKADRPQSIRKFGTMFQILKLIYALIQEDKYITKRDIYYQHPDIYHNQAFIDRIIHDIACMLEIPRWELHILATCKGLVVGMLQFEDSNGVHIDCQQASLGVQIPAHTKDVQNIHTDAKFILVVEKDATFQKLLDCNFCWKMKPCILVTGKGFPDNGTRLLLKQLWSKFRIPTFILVDADPHGIEIMAVYKFGSKSQAFENQHLTVPSAEWIGVWPEDIRRLNIKESSLIQMSERDLLKARALKKRPYFINDEILLSQIDLMIDMSLKAEIQCLDAISSNYLCNVYLPMKIRLLLPELNHTNSVF